MNKYTLLLLLGFWIQAQSCSNAQCQTDGTVLAATAFFEKQQTCPDATIVDVRTPEEFAKGRLPNALNINWNSPDFMAQTAALDKTKPIFIYCLSGARSAAAAKKMRSESFKTVVELEGGILKWRAAQLPEIKGDPAKTTGIDQTAFAELLKGDKLVLIDFYADWCGPCKKMAPYLEEIKTEMADKVRVVRINADDNQQIMQQLGIESLPVLLLYKDGNQVWRNAGFIEKADVVAKLAM